MKIFTIGLVILVIFNLFAYPAVFARKKNFNKSI
jgi:hypothetical protein